jgi:hypothetical protein
VTCTGGGRQTGKKDEAFPWGVLWGGGTTSADQLLIIIKSWCGFAGMCGVLALALPPTHLAGRDGCQLGEDGVAHSLDVIVVLQGGSWVGLWGGWLVGGGAGAAGGGSRAGSHAGAQRGIGTSCHSPPAPTLSPLSRCWMNAAASTRS